MQSRRRTGRGCHEDVSGRRRFQRGAENRPANSGGLDFHIVEAEDGEKALQACKRELPDAILLDWNMPVMDGYEFLGHLRRLPGGNAPRVVFCTTENGVDHISRALHAGADQYIMKPFDKEIVAAKFQEVGLLQMADSMSV
jgi:two-component system chemotaxis response regulator CheY